MRRPRQGPCLAATWLAFTILLAGMFAAGIWRMTRRSSGDEPGLSPLKALIVLASVVGLCALSPVPVFLLRGVVDTKVILYGVLALCLAFTLAAGHISSSVEIRLAAAPPEREMQVATRELSPC